MAGDQGLDGLGPALARDIAEALETTPDLLPLMSELLQNRSDLSGCTQTALAALRALGLERGARVLDLGAGRGELAIAVARECRAFVTSVEAFAPFVATARAAVAEAGIACKVIEGDPRRAVQESSGFDAVLLVAVGPIFGDHRTTVGTIRHTVRRRGLMLIANVCLDGERPSGPAWDAYADRATTERALTMAGDRLVMAEPLRPSLSDWNDHAMRAIRKRAAELASAQPEREHAIRLYVEDQEQAFAELENGPVVSVLWVS